MSKPEDKLKVKPKRVETLTERFERLHHKYDDGPEPKHNNDKSIVDMEKWNSMKGLEKKTPIVRPKPFKNDDPTTYPMNQKKNISNWDLLMMTAKNPKTKEDRIQAKEIRKIIYKDYNRPSQRKFMGEDELKLIGKHPSQRIKYPEVTIPKVDINYKPYVPEPSGPSLADVMKNSARMKPGLSEDLIGINAQIKKNIDYVLGEKSESKNEKNNNDKEETYD